MQDSKEKYYLAHSLIPSVPKPSGAWRRLLAVMARTAITRPDVWCTLHTVFGDLIFGVWYVPFSYPLLSYQP